MTTATGEVCCYRSQRLTLSSGERTWMVLGRDHRMVEPAEGYLEYLRAQQASPNTVKVVCAGVGAVVAVPGCVRPALGRGDVGELRGLPDMAAHRGRAQGHRQSRVVVITSFLVRWSDAEEVEDLV
jgi:hypothetical protein